VHVIDYTVTDDGGNKAMKKRSVVIIDVDPPAVTLRGEAEYTMYTGGKLKERNAAGESVPFADAGTDVADNYDAGPLSAAGFDAAATSIVDVTSEDKMATACKLKVCRKGWAAAVGPKAVDSPFPEAGTFTIEYISADSHGNVGRSSRVLVVVQPSESSSPAVAIGISFAVVLLLICAVVGGVFGWRHYRRKRQSADLKSPPHQTTYNDVFDAGAVYADADADTGGSELVDYAASGGDNGETGLVAAALHDVYEDMSLVSEPEPPSRNTLYLEPSELQQRMYDRTNATVADAGTYDQALDTAEGDTAAAAYKVGWVL